MAKEMLTTKEVAEYLSINEKQVYRLIKERKIPATRITGKWLFPKQLVDDWVIASAKENVGPALPRRALDDQAVIAGSNDLALELLAKHVNLQFPPYTVSLSNVGSLGGLIALRHGSCHIAACHILNSETGEYNVPAVQSHFADVEVKVLNLSYRDQGLMVPRGNPKQIHDVKDLVTSRAKVVNRQEGSGTRVLFDYALKQNGIEGDAIEGYSNVAYSHIEVALEIFSGAADAGVGILAAARMMGLDFVPLGKERFDLVIPAEYYFGQAVRAVRQVLGSSKFKVDVARMHGYDTRDTGKLMYENARRLA
jgi:excisionase family DNA binding protein